MIIGSHKQNLCNSILLVELHSYFVRYIFCILNTTLLLSAIQYYRIQPMPKNFPMVSLISLFVTFLVIMRVFCPRAGPSLQAQEPRLQICRKHVFHRKLRNQGCSFSRDWRGAVASRCFSHPTLFSIWTDLKRSEKISGAPTRRWEEWIWLTGPSRLYRNSPHG